MSLLYEREGDKRTHKQTYTGHIELAIRLENRSSFYSANVITITGGALLVLDLDNINFPHPSLYEFENQFLLGVLCG